MNCTMRVCLASVVQTSLMLAHNHICTQPCSEWLIEQPYNFFFCQDSVGSMGLTSGPTLQARQREWQTSARTAAMRAARERLPAAAHAGAVEAALAAHRVLVVSGATGCGKSTQVHPSTLCACPCVGGPRRQVCAWSKGLTSHLWTAL